jgi:hypothetical protein
MALSIGILRKRLPVGAKIALATAGTMADVPASPIPPGGSKNRDLILFSLDAVMKTLVGRTERRE